MNAPSPEATGEDAQAEWETLVAAPGPLGAHIIIAFEAVKRLSEGASFDEKAEAKSISHILDELRLDKQAIATLTAERDALRKVAHAASDVTWRYSNRPSEINDRGLWEPLAIALGEWIGNYDTALALTETKP